VATNSFCSACAGATRTHLNFKTQSSSVEFPNAGSGSVLIGANETLLL
jgi:hypothetical protein